MHIREMDFRGKLTHHHKHDAVDSQRSFGNIGGHDALAAATLVRLECQLLLAFGQLGVQGQANYVHRKLVANAGDDILYVIFSWHKHQDISLQGLGHENVPHRSRGRHNIVRHTRKSEADVDAELLPGNDVDSGPREKFLKGFARFQSCRHDDNLEVLTDLQDGLQAAEEQVGGDGALVSLINDDAAVRGENFVFGHLREEMTILYNISQYTAQARVP